MRKIKGPKIYPKSVRYEYNVVRTEFRLDDSFTKLIYAESIKIETKSDILQKQIEKRINLISKDYDTKVNKLLDRLIVNNDLEKYSVENLNKLVTSVMRVTKSLSSSLTSIVIGLEDIK